MNKTKWYQVEELVFVAFNVPLLIVVLTIFGLLTGAWFPMAVLGLFVLPYVLIILPIGLSELHDRRR